MTKDKEINYKEAYVELYEIIKRLPNTQKSKIPEHIIEGIKNNIDNNYTFIFNDTISLLEQNYKTETKALLVELYERYLAPEEEKQFWKDYDRTCLNMISEEKMKKYNTEDIFNIQNNNYNDEKVQKNQTAVVEYRESIFSKIRQWIKRIFNKE